MSQVWIRYFGKERCSGMAIEGRRRALFVCREDGRTMWEPMLRVPPSAAMIESVGSHCNANCRSVRYRSPYPPGVPRGLGCNCGRRR